MLHHPPLHPLPSREGKQKEPLSPYGRGNKKNPLSPCACLREAASAKAGERPPPLAKGDGGILDLPGIRDWPDSQVKRKD